MPTGFNTLIEATHLAMGGYCRDLKEARTLRGKKKETAPALCSMPSVLQ